MRCPTCKHLVDPETDNRWAVILDHPNPTPMQIIFAIYLWDQGALNVGGQSVLPTELRDLVKGALRPHKDKLHGVNV